MAVEVLSPQIGHLSQEYVLVQAWRKASAYIRYHNWYSDVLELDRVATDLPNFIQALSEELKSPETWKSDPLSLVAAPKSQNWHVSAETHIWQPTSQRRLASRIRPLAHVSVRDQVAATALMMCLADRVETRQGDSSRIDMTKHKSRRRIQSYGNRLYCAADGRNLRHRWASRRLYRQFYQDYQAFLSRPEIVSREIESGPNESVIIIQSDLSQFFDRVTPELLLSKIARFQTFRDDDRFFAIAERLLNWTWRSADLSNVKTYAKSAGIRDLTHVALPQGLVAAGFFSNIVLMDFDENVRKEYFGEIRPGVFLQDICRYVDDLRIVVTANKELSTAEIEESLVTWIQEGLDKSAPGLLSSAAKTHAATFGSEGRPLILQSRRMARVQAAISGGFDAVAGEEILDSIEGLIRSQNRFAGGSVNDGENPLLAVPDTKDATVARFAAGRFRVTYRSIRPLLERREIGAFDEFGSLTETSSKARVPRSQEELDEEARNFAVGLVEQWMEDPSNVRLLRIGLDLWPSKDLIVIVLALLKPYTSGFKSSRPRQWIAWYCLAEIYRAAATETGMVTDSESLPSLVDLSAFRLTLRDEAVRLLSSAYPELPWYVKQQILLFLAVFDPESARVSTGSSLNIYASLIRYLNGEAQSLKPSELTTVAILARRSFCTSEKAVTLAASQVSRSTLEQIAVRDPRFGLEILDARPDLSNGLAPRLREDLCLSNPTPTGEWIPLSKLVLNAGTKNAIRNELSVLEFASLFLTEVLSGAVPTVIAPCQVLIRLAKSPSRGGIQAIRIRHSRVSPRDSIYSPPRWSEPNEHWRFQLGFLTRFILAGTVDFTTIGKGSDLRIVGSGYSSYNGHWYERLYGLYNAQSAFGDKWLPISDWIERFLSALLFVPGNQQWSLREWALGGPQEALNEIEARRTALSDLQGGSGCLILPVSMPRPFKGNETRPLRVCVLQTVIPAKEDFVANDLSLSGNSIRARHRRHLSAALAAVERLLELRQTHMGKQGRLDWLILPELSVHPRDVQTHLIPFVRKHKAIVLAGVTYEQASPGSLLVNSAYWVYPSWSPSRGLNVVVRQQGKQHLSPEEERLNSPVAQVEGFRPCQWLLGYKWSPSKADRPLWLTAAVCYDATDLGLVADIRHLSDVLAVPALNQDVNTFDQMALALHYHMFQLVIVANNGNFGGSNAYAPYRDQPRRQVFHLHGQPQASAAFLELDPVSEFLTRKQTAKKVEPKGGKSNIWKYPPATM